MLRNSTMAALALSIALVSTASARAATPRSKQQRAVLALLSAYEYEVDHDALRRTGPEVDLVLIHLAGRDRLRPTLRLRALAALAVFPTRSSRRFLESLLYERSLTKDGLGTLLRRQAMRSLGTAFGEEEIETIAQFRTSENAELREACALALGDTGSSRAIPLLQAWLPNEQELFVRTAVDRSIMRIHRGETKR